MTRVEKLSKLESRFRPFLSSLGGLRSISFYSNQKKKFLKKFAKDHLNFDPIEISGNSVKLWDIEFNLPIFNAAGMFKYAEAYYTVAKQGAGGWLAGTTTGKPRTGNFKEGVLHPFIPLPKSASAINWMGLPNKGHLHNADIISKLNKIPKCPIGASLSYDSGSNEAENMRLMIEGLQAYEKAGVDFIEINESCPNVTEEGHELSNNKLEEGLIRRIEALNKNFLSTRVRNLPVIVKLSNDTDSNLIPEAIDLLTENGFDGINLGNTSAKYEKRLEKVHHSERKSFKLFTNCFGGGVSGEPIKSDSFNLSKIASDYTNKINLSREFHVIRTGGIKTADDIMDSQKEGIKLFQWYTGYFTEFSRFGHDIYLNLNNQL